MFSSNSVHKGVPCKKITPSHQCCTSQPNPTINLKTMALEREWEKNVLMMASLCLYSPCLHGRMGLDLPPEAVRWTPFWQCSQKDSGGHCHWVQWGWHPDSSTTTFEIVFGPSWHHVLEYPPVANALGWIDGNQRAVVLCAQLSEVATIATSFKMSARLDLNQGWGMGLVEGLWKIAFPVCAYALILWKSLCVLEHIKSE